MHTRAVIVSIILFGRPLRGDEFEISRAPLAMIMGSDDFLGDWLDDPAGESGFCLGAVA